MFFSCDPMEDQFIKCHFAPELHTPGTDHLPVVSVLDIRPRASTAQKISALEPSTRTASEKQN